MHRTVRGAARDAEQPGPFVIVLVGASAMTYGLNPLLTTIMPMQYTSLNRVALGAGLLDAMIYVGSSFSGAFAGFLSDRFGWSAVFVSLGGAQPDRYPHAGRGPAREQGQKQIEKERMETDHGSRLESLCADD